MEIDLLKTRDFARIHFNCECGIMYSCVNILVVNVTNDYTIT